MERSKQGTRLLNTCDAGPGPAHAGSLLRARQHGIGCGSPDSSFDCDLLLPASACRCKKSMEVTHAVKPAAVMPTPPTAFAIEPPACTRVNMARMPCHITAELTKQRLQNNLDTQISAKRNMQELLATACEALSASRRLFQEQREHKASKSASIWKCIDGPGPTRLPH